ncbi:hypothetical protein TNCV_4563311 [Trichonephila clavipes]|uniref:Uncharacterized protein n=1 Tax=Trichonephila clavipes TaxID=2585209 RepID=A0A8X7BE24_TRICX|nr:hypothetical protein TNCV_4563311 [Trichonephila clavipes]
MKSEVATNNTYHKCYFLRLDSKEQVDRSSTFQFDNYIRNDINMKHACLDVIQEPWVSVKLPSSVKITLNLPEPKGHSSAT